MTTDTPHDVARRLHRAYRLVSQQLIDATYAGVDAEVLADLKAATAAALAAWREARAALGPDPRRTTRPTCAVGHRIDGPPCGAMCVRGTRRIDR